MASLSPQEMKRYKNQLEIPIMSVFWLRCVKVNEEFLRRVCQIASPYLLKSVEEGKNVYFYCQKTVKVKLNQKGLGNETVLHR